MSENHERTDVTGLDWGRSLRQVQRSNVDGTRNQLRRQFPATFEGNVSRHRHAKAFRP